MLIGWLRRWRFNRRRFHLAAALFDPDWYAATYPGVRRRDAFADYMGRGWQRGRNPHPLFDTRWYLDQNDDVDAARINPFLHFLADGWREGRDPHPLFSVTWYAQQHPEVRASAVNPLLHYVAVGAGEGRDPHPSFQTSAYLAGLADPEPARAQPLVHYLAAHPVAADGTRTPRRRPPRALRKIAPHFRHVVALAACEAGAMQDAPRKDEAPLISFVVPVFNTKPRYLDDLLTSFRQQPSSLCELIFSDDGSSARRTRGWLDRHAGEPGITIVRSPDNRGIAAATNAGLARAAGAWIGLLDHDDALAPFAVARIAGALGRNPQCQFLYTDEVIADGKLRPVGYFLKPAWDEVLLSGVNYVNHLSLYRKDRLTAIGGVREGFQGSQDYDLLLRYVAGLDSGAILHLPYPAYLWRRDGASYSVTFLAASTANARRALSEHFGRDGRPVTVGAALSPNLHRVTFEPSRPAWPLVSIVIPSRDGFPLISRVLDGLSTKTDYPAIEVIVVDNGSTDPAVLALYDRYRGGPMPFRAETRAEPFNFSRAVNQGVTLAGGDLILLLNNDIEVQEGGWLKEMVSCFAYERTGIVGAKLLFPDLSIQHVGVIAGLGGLAGHWFTGRKQDCPGPQGRLRVRQSLSVVTGACMLVSKTCFAEVGLFDEEVFPIAYNDVDFCLRAVEKGFRVVFTPFATLLHHESASRGSDETEANIARFERDKASLRERHRTDSFEDRAFNPWFSKHHRDFVPVLLDHLPGER